MRDLDLTVTAYVDGELDTEARARFEAEMSRDPGLAERVALQRRLRDRLAATYDPILAEPPPMRLTLAVEAANDRAVRRLGAAQWGAVAASLVIGVFVGRTALPEREPLAVRGELARALDRQLATDSGAIQIGLSFRTSDGRYCRTFQSASDRLAGLACRKDGGWQARTVTVWIPPAASDYRLARSDTPAEVLATVDAIISGEPLDATAEQQARARGWRP